MGEESAEERGWNSYGTYIMRLEELYRKSYEDCAEDERVECTKDILQK